MPPKGKDPTKPNSKGNNQTHTTQPTDQYQHFIPRFILRQYQVGPRRSKAERQRIYRRTGIDPEYVYYWDIAKGTLDTRPIGQVYGVYNLYQDCKNTDNVNAAEQKLSVLERKAATIINDLHAALPTRKFSIKRRPLEDLRKFLFIMHYRHSSLASVYFDENHPDNIVVRLWIEQYKRSHALGSPAEVWLHVLLYYLDNSHSQLMNHAAEIMDKYGVVHFHTSMMKNHIPPDLEHYPAVAYQTSCGGHYTCIWEAADGEEFVLTHNGFGLWEGLINGEPDIHRIFVISPRIVIVLRMGMIMLDDVAKTLRSAISSSLLAIEQIPPEVVYNKKQGFPTEDGDGLMGTVENYRSSKPAEEDLFDFNIKKLTAAETMLVNEVLLVNVQKDGSATFASKPCMLRTARTFCTRPLHIRTNPIISDLVKLLEDDLTSSDPISSIDPLKLVHFELFTLLLDISTGQGRFVSAYDRARAVQRVLADDVHCSSVFIFEHDERARALHTSFLRDCDQKDLLQLACCVHTLPSDISTSLLSMLFNVMQSVGFFQKPISSPLDTLQDEVVAVTFLELASVDAGAWYKLMTADPNAAPILSRVFEEGTTLDDQAMKLVQHVISNPQKFASGYEKALILYRAICMSGPMKNGLTTYCASAIATITRGLASFLPKNERSVRPKACLVIRIPQAHWLDLVGMVKDEMRRAGLDFASGHGPVPSVDLHETANDVIVVGVLTWMSKQRSDFLAEFCRSRNVQLVKVGDVSGAK